MLKRVRWNRQISCPHLLLAALGLVLATVTLPAHASNHNSGTTILIVTDFNAPGDTSGLNRRDDDQLVYFLGAGDPAYIGTADEGKVNFGNGAAGSPNETLMIPSLGYTVDTTGMGGRMQAGNFPWLGALVGRADERAAIDNADLVIFPLNRSGNYRNDRYRNVDCLGCDPGKDINGLTVEESWNGIETPVLTFNSSYAAGGSTVVNPDGTSFRFGWLEAHTQNNSIEDATQMQVEPDQLSNPFFAGLTTTVDPNVPGGVEVELYDWTYDAGLLGTGYTNGQAPPGVIIGSAVYSRAPSFVDRDPSDPSQGEAGRGVVPGGEIVSGFGGTVANGGGGGIIDIPKGTDFNVPDQFGDATNIPMTSPGNPSDVPFGMAGARRVLLPTWGYSLPVVGASTGEEHFWGKYQTADFFQLTENVIAEMLLNPDGAATPGGDFDADGDVDGADFLMWQRNLGDATNLAAWEAAYGSGGALAASVGSVPEPSSLLLAIGSAIALAASRRRRS